MNKLSNNQKLAVKKLEKVKKKIQAYLLYSNFFITRTLKEFVNMPGNKFLK